MKRRDFVRTTGAATAGTLIQSSRMMAEAGTMGGRPNVLFIMTDQQFADAMSCRMGEQFIKTPAMDSLAATGTLFSRAYTPNPLCRPARNSIFTGRHCHELGVQNNGDRGDIDPRAFPFMGAIFRDAGYDTGYVGKWHMNHNTRDTEKHGFETMVDRKGPRPDENMPAPAAEFIRRKRDKPFLLVVSFMNPHNICQYARGEKLPDGPIGDDPSPEKCPPIVPNHLPPENETDIIADMRRSYQRSKMFPVSGFDENKWRQFRWAYYRMIELVDAQIGEVLGALRDSGQEEDTVVMFLSDHGDCHGAHQWNQKTVLYDESSRVPFIISHKGATKVATAEQLVQTGVDVLPTLCDYAGIAAPAGLPGRSLKGIANGAAPKAWRKYVVASTHLVQGEPLEDGAAPKPHGRMVRGERYKYCLYSEGRRRESLVDMIDDPGETVNLAGNPRLVNVLQQYRRNLKEHAEATGDSLALKLLSQS